MELNEQLDNAYYNLLEADNRETNEKELLATHYTGHIASKVGQISTTGLHVLSYVRHHPGVNGRKIADDLGILQGTLSKKMTRLINDGFMRDETRPENKRERYYFATDAGLDLASRHEDLQQSQFKQHEQVYNQFTNDEKQAILRFLTTMHHAQ